MLITLDGYTAGEVSLTELGTSAMALIATSIKVSQ